MITRNSYEIICTCMTQRLASAMQTVSDEMKRSLCEVRLRIGRPIAFVYPTKTFFLHKGGSLREKWDKSEAVCPEKSDMTRITEILCRFSVHSCSRELSEGFFTIENGIRVGAAGTFSRGERNTMKYINALNFRIVRQIEGCGENLYKTVMNGTAQSILICGGVNSGKTTLLRDLCRLCGNERKTVLIDERSELAGCINGVPTMDIGLQTDVLEGCSRAEGILTAIRTLSPKIIFCDEIGSEADAEAIMKGYGSGTAFAATIHAGSFQELMHRKIGSELLKSGVFSYAVILEGEENPSKIREIRRLEGNA